MEGPGSPHSMLGLSREDLEAMNLQQLRSRDTAIEQVLGQAGHVSLYDFDCGTASWVRPPRSPGPRCAPWPRNPPFASVRVWMRVLQSIYSLFLPFSLSYFHWVRQETMIYS